MHLIMATEYSIRALLYLTVIERMAPAPEISEKARIPKQYLVTMSRRLKEAGLIEARGGAAGGYYLARPPEDITLMDIISVTESTMCLSPCLEGGEGCGLGGADDCAIRGTLLQLQEMIGSFLGEVTLRQLADGTARQQFLS